MNTIKELFEAAFIRAAIDNLIERKFELDNAFNEGLINYAEYEELKARIQADLGQLGPDIPFT